MVLPHVKLDLDIFVDGKIFPCAMFTTDMLSLHRLVNSQSALSNAHNRNAKFTYDGKLSLGLGPT